MLDPTPAAHERLDELRPTDTVDLGHARVTRQGRAGVLELCNPRHLNAEDGEHARSETETAVDLILLDPEIEVGVFRGGFVDHPRYAGERYSAPESTSPTSTTGASTSCSTSCATSAT